MRVPVVRVGPVRVLVRLFIVRVRMAVGPDDAAVVVVMMVVPIIMAVPMLVREPNGSAIPS